MATLLAGGLRLAGVVAVVAVRARGLGVLGLVAPGLVGLVRLSVAVAVAVAVALVLVLAEMLAVAGVVRPG